MNAISFIRRGGTIMGAFKTKFAVTTLLIVFVIALFPGMRLKADTSGTCGDNATWTLVDGGILVISGYGLIYDSAFEANTNIIDVIIEPGIDSIDSSAFKTCTIHKYIIAN